MAPETRALLVCAGHNTTLLATVSGTHRQEVGPPGGLPIIVFMIARYTFLWVRVRVREVKPGQRVFKRVESCEEEGTGER